MVSSAAMLRRRAVLLQQLLTAAEAQSMADTEIGQIKGAGSATFATTNAFFCERARAIVDASSALPSDGVSPGFVVCSRASNRGAIGEVALRQIRTAICWGGGFASDGGGDRSAI
eukprot:6192388-Prymnesium_polylepis.1